MSELVETVIQKLAETSPADILWSLFAFAALAISWIGYLASTFLSRRHERKMRGLRREDRSLEVIFFDTTSKAQQQIQTLRSQPLTSVKFDDRWDIVQRKMIESWDSRDGGPIIRPADSIDAAALADRIYTLACCTLSATIPAIRGYLRDDQLADERDGFRHVRFLACLARPHVSLLTWRDVPRLVIVPVGTARQLVGLAESEIVCKHSPKNRKVWLQVLREMGIAWRDNDQPLYYRGIATLDIGFE